MIRKASLREGATSGLGYSARKLLVKKIREKSLRCGMNLSPAEVKELQMSLSAGF